jgi:methyl-accepting chemotaxis protein
MKQFYNLPIFLKFLSVAIGTTAILMGVLLFFYEKSDQKETVQAMVEKARAICLVSESARQEMEEKWRLGLFSNKDIKKYASTGQTDKLMAVIPVVSAWKASMRKAKAGGYTFRVPKFNPRNPNNEPDYGESTKIEGPALEKIKSENLSEYYIIDKQANTVRYFLPVRLSKSCLACHGDPSQSKTLWGRDDGKDPTGQNFENWKEGEIHGAFEVIQSMDKADAAFRGRLFRAIAIVLAGIAFAGAVLFFVTRSITQPITRGVEFAKNMSHGDLSCDIKVVQADETGKLAQAMNKMISNLRNMIGQINQGVDTLSGSSHELTHVSQSLSTESTDASQMAVSVAAAAEEMSANMNSVAAAVEQTSANVNSVSAAAEEMNATINEIAKNSEQSKQITQEAVNQANQAAKKVGELGNAATEIGQVTKTITEISDQTNLLALNATIEAARAGEAGKGFAVVANEIKELANQTANATSEIRTKIERMQDSSNETTNQINEIIKVINDVNIGVTSIATAVEQQSSVTREIAENVSQASLGIADVTENVSQCSVVADEVAQNISSVSKSSEEISKKSVNVKDTAKQLSDLAGRLMEMMTGFKLS